jgi:hypothetical protein
MLHGFLQTACFRTWLNTGARAVDRSHVRPERHGPGRIAPDLRRMRQPRQAARQLERTLSFQRRSNPDGRRAASGREIKRLCQNIISGQQAEIDQMRARLRDLDG